ncbi:hypothetical protein [Leptospira koniambonensis]|uniref:hypothetical protein n=1 Tax=Leptospira koniambonensis TaxID=2484950 RepID=UPI003EB7A55A
MTESKPHPILAGVFDFYFAACLIGSILGLTNSLAKVTYSSSLTLPLIIILILITFIYYKWIADRQMWLTPGEIVTGRIVENNTKKWTNPYGKNRWLLFTSLLINIIIDSNGWDSLYTGVILEFSKWVVISVGMILLTLGAILAGKNKNYWIVFAILPAAIGIASIAMNPISGEVSRQVSGKEIKLIGYLINATFIVLHISSYMVYSVLLKKSNSTV